MASLWRPPLLIMTATPRTAAPLYPSTPAPPSARRRPRRPGYRAPAQWGGGGRAVRRSGRALEAAGRLAATAVHGLPHETAHEDHVRPDQPDDVARLDRDLDAVGPA